MKNNPGSSATVHFPNVTCFRREIIPRQGNLLSFLGTPPLTLNYLSANPIELIECRWSWPRIGWLRSCPSDVNLKESTGVLSGTLMNRIFLSSGVAFTSYPSTLRGETFKRESISPQLVTTSVKTSGPYTYLYLWRNRSAILLRQ